MKPNVLLIFCLPVERNEFLGAIIPPLGLESVAAYVRDISNVRIVDMRFEKTLDKIISEHNPSIIGINIKNTVRSEYAYKTARKCKHLCSDAMLVAGGLHATCVPEEALKNGFDAVVRGDGEIPFRKIVEGKPLRSIAGISYKKNNRFVHNENGNMIVNLDEFPHPARDMRGKNYNYSIIQGKIKADIIETSRGCSNYCTFCAPASYHHGNWRFHSSEYVIEELMQISETTKFVMLADDNFTADFKRAEIICDSIIAAGLNKTFIVQIRPFMGNMQLKRKMVKAGFMNVTSGAETGIKKNIDKYHKNINPADMKKINTEWKKAGAKLVINSFVFGESDDSEEELLSMGSFAREVNCDYMDIIWLTPYPGTQMREEYLKKGMILSNDWKKYSQGYMLVKHSHLTVEKLKELRWRTWCKYYSPKRFAYQVMSYIQFFSRKFELSLIDSLDFLYSNRHMIFGNNYEYSSFDYPKRKIILTYIKEYLNAFPEDELDMTDSFNDFLHIWKIEKYLKFLNGKVLQVSLVDGKNNISNIVIKTATKCFESVRFRRDKVTADISFNVDIYTIADILCLEYDSLILNLLKLQWALFKIVSQEVIRKCKIL